MSDESKPASPAEVNDDTVATVSESSLDECLNNCANQSIIIKPILACPGVVSKIEYTILHIHASVVLDNVSPPPSSLTVIKSPSDENYNIASFWISDEFLCTQDDNSPPTDEEWKIAQTIPAMFPSPKPASHISQINSYPLLDIRHEVNNCNCDWDPNNGDVDDFNHDINNDNRNFVNNNNNYRNNNTTIATNFVGDHSCTQSTAPEGDPQPTQDHSTDLPSSPTSINEIYNIMCYIKKSSTKITQPHDVIFDDSYAPLININPISTSTNNDNTKILQVPPLQTSNRIEFQLLFQLLTVVSLLLMVMLIVMLLTITLSFQQLLKEDPTIIMIKIIVTMVIIIL